METLKINCEQLAYWQYCVRNSILLGDVLNQCRNPTLSAKGKAFNFLQYVSSLSIPELELLKKSGDGQEKIAPEAMGKFLDYLLSRDTISRIQVEQAIELKYHKVNFKTALFFTDVNGRFVFRRFSSRAESFDKIRPLTFGLIDPKSELSCDNITFEADGKGYITNLHIGQNALVIPPNPNYEADLIVKLENIVDWFNYLELKYLFT